MTKNNEKSISRHQIARKTVLSRCLRIIAPSIACLVILFVVITTSSANAVTYISQSYSTDEKLSTGSLVSLVNNTSDKVSAADSGSVDNLLGIVINADNSLLALSSGKTNQAQVATSGTLDVLVSDINGTISRGSQITASPISGVGMKATTNTRVIGIAQGDLTATNSKKQTFTDADGVKQTVNIGQIPVLVNVSYFFKEPDKTIVPAAIQNVANAVAGKSVSALPILVSCAIFIITLIVVVSIIYAMINSSIISVGRNPMSQSAIYRDIVQLSALVLAILAVGLVSIYLVLTRL